MTLWIKKSWKSGGTVSYAISAVSTIQQTLFYCVCNELYILYSTHTGYYSQIDCKKDITFAINVVFR